MMRVNLFNLIFLCVFLSCALVSNAKPEADTIANDQNTAHTSEQDSNTSPSAVPNAPELFAKLLETEEQLQELNGKLQNSEHAFANLTKKVDDLYEKVAQIKTDRAAQQDDSNNDKDSDSDFLNAINLIKNGKNEEAIKFLTSNIQKAKTEKKQLDNEGEIYYWLAKAYMNTKASSKAAHWFAKSYRYYSNVMPKNVLVELIEALAVDKKFKQACPLLHKLDAKYLTSLDKNKQTYFAVLKKTHCSKK